MVCVARDNLHNTCIQSYNITVTSELTDITTKFKTTKFTGYGMTDMSIRTLLYDVEVGRIALPEIQREFSWSKQKARDLIDSLYNQYPVGMVFLWRPLEIEYFRLLENQKKTETPGWLVLDGQQRITSLNLIKRGDICISFNIDKEIFQIENKAIQNDPKWVRVDDIWKTDSATTLGELTHKLSMPMTEVYEKYIKKIQRIEQILSVNIPVFEIRDEDYSRITEIYIRLNEKGTKLKKAEINLALLVLKFPKVFYEELTKIVDKFEDRGLDVNFFLRCFVCISTNQSKFEPLKKYLSNPNEEKILKDLNIISEKVQESFNFITSHFGIDQDIHQKLIPSNIAIIPLMMYMIKYDGEATSAKELNKIILWFYCVSHYGWFSGSSESTLNEDLRGIQRDRSSKKLVGEDQKRTR